MTRRPRHVAPPTRLAERLDAPDHLVGPAVVVAVVCQEANQSLVDDRQGDDLGPGQAADLRDEPGRMGAAAVDELLDALRPSERIAA